MTSSMTERIGRLRVEDGSGGSGGTIRRWLGIALGAFVLLLLIPTTVR